MLAPTLGLLLFIPLLFHAKPLEAADQAYGNRPRGVSAEKASFYEERDEFKCLDGSKTIPFSQVNDDYCDCNDGTDEPGTSACHNGVFHCRNYGYRFMDVPSSRVNDGICDCCDGSDEWDTEIVQCPNVCQELGAKARQAHGEQRQLVERGYAKRVELAKEGSQSMEEKKAEVEKMKKELEDLQPIKAAVEASKNDAEKRESEAKDEEDRKWNESQDQKRREEMGEIFTRVDTHTDGKATIDEFKAAVKLATDHEMLDEEVKDVFGEETELDFEKFLTKRREIRSFFRAKKPAATTEEPSTNEDSSSPPPPSEASELDADEDDPNDDASLEPEDVAHQHEHEDDGEDKKPDYNDETKRLIEEASKHRDQWRETTNKISDLEVEIRNTENFLQFEYGQDFAWAPMKGQCAELNQAQYTYRLCLFDRAVQKDRHGHHEIGLGNWRGWEGPDDDSHPGGKYSAQKYADGQQCWNGPARSTLVHVECGEEFELYDVKEPAKCEYEFRIRAPAACPDPSTLKDPFAVHTEL